MDTSRKILKIKIQIRTSLLLNLYQKIIDKKMIVDLDLTFSATVSRFSVRISCMEDVTGVPVTTSYLLALSSNYIHQSV
jgi:hypothetical protein